MRTRVKQLISRLSPSLIKWLKFQRFKRHVMTGTFKRYVPEEALTAKYQEALRWVARESEHNCVGDYLEFGVYHGTSLACMHRALKSMNLQDARLFGFDSFEGLPETAQVEDDGVWATCDFASDVQLTRRFLASRGVELRRVTLAKGWFEDTLTATFIEQHSIRRAGIIMVDCDLYSSAKVALSFCSSLITGPAVIFFDDWNSDGLGERNLGERRAFEEWMLQNPHLASIEFGGYSANSRVFKIVQRQSASK
jgi:O-methyltransferase